MSSKCLHHFFQYEHHTFFESNTGHEHDAFGSACRSRSPPTFWDLHIFAIGQLAIGTKLFVDEASILVACDPAHEFAPFG